MSRKGLSRIGMPSKSKAAPGVKARPVPKLPGRQR